jgi:hypothetical protein
MENLILIRPPGRRSSARVSTSTFSRSPQVLGVALGVVALDLSAHSILRLAHLEGEVILNEHYLSLAIALTNDQSRIGVALHACDDQAE